MSSNFLNFPKSLIDAVSQGKISSDTPVSPPVARTQTSFKQVNEESLLKVIREYESNMQQFSVKNSTNSPYGLTRKPWVFTTFETITSFGQNAQANLAEQITNLEEIGTEQAADEKTILFSLNPVSVSWSVSQRGTSAKNKSGSVMHYWYDPLRKTYYDDPVINISFQTGNIKPLYSGDNPNDIAQGTISPSLRNFYQFMSLVDQPKITKKGNANLIHILYRSSIFPSMVLTGFFDPNLVVQFQDSSQDPNKITGWSANFNIYSVTPQLNNYADLEFMFKEEYGILSNASTSANTRSTNSRITAG